MLRTFANSPLTFKPCDEEGNWTGERMYDIPYHLRAHNYKINADAPTMYDIVNFEEITRLLLMTTAGDVSIDLLDPDGGLIQEEMQTQEFWAMGSNYTGHFFELDWKTLGAYELCYLIAYDEAGNYLRSERLYEPATPPIQLDYKIKGRHFTYGENQCKPFTGFFDLKMEDYDLYQEVNKYQNGSFLWNKIAHAEERTHVLSTHEISPDQAEKFARIMQSSDEIRMYQKACDGRDVSDPIRMFRDELVQLRNHRVKALVSASARISFDESVTARLVGSNYADFTPELLPETEIGATEFTANVESEALEHQFQLATDPEFTNIIIDSGWIPELSFTFTGLSICTKYYYRVRGRRCEEISPWIFNQNKHFRSFDFRGAARSTNSFFDEKITGLRLVNGFGMATGVSFKYWPGVTEPTDANLSLMPSLSLSDLEAQINAPTAPDEYWINVSVTGFASLAEEAVVGLEYTSATFFTRVGCLNYRLSSAGGYTKNIRFLMLAERHFHVQVTNPSATGAQFMYGLFASGSNWTSYQYTSLGALNNAIDSFQGATHNLVVGIHCAPPNTQPIDFDILIFYQDTP